MSQNSTGPQGLYQGWLYFFSFFYTVFIGCNMTFTVCVAMWADLFFCVFLFVLVVILCDMCICVWYVTCVFVCCIVVVILPPGKTHLQFEINVKRESQYKIFTQSHCVSTSMFTACTGHVSYNPSLGYIAHRHQHPQPPPVIALQRGFAVRVFTEVAILLSSSDKEWTRSIIACSNLTLHCARTVVHVGFQWSAKTVMAVKGKFAKLVAAVRLYKPTVLRTCLVTMSLRMVKQQAQVPYGILQRPMESEVLYNRAGPSLSQLR
jgi:hypothetical protein